MTLDDWSLKTTCLKKKLCFFSVKVPRTVANQQFNNSHSLWLKTLFSHMCFVGFCCESRKLSRVRRLRNKAKLAALLIPFTFADRNRSTWLDGYEIENDFYICTSFENCFLLSLPAKSLELFVYYDNYADVDAVITEQKFVRQLAGWVFGDCFKFQQLFYSKVRTNFNFSWPINEAIMQWSDRDLFTPH